MTATRTCAAPGCDRAVEPGSSRGRPPIYCSPPCRPSWTGRGRSRPSRITVEVDEDDSNTDDRAGARVIFVVRPRRGNRAVTVANGVGRFTAAALAADLRGLFEPTTRQEGVTTE